MTTTLTNECTNPGKICGDEIEKSSSIQPIYVREKVNIDRYSI